MLFAPDTHLPGRVGHDAVNRLHNIIRRFREDALGRSTVAVYANRNVKGNFSEEWHAEFLRRLLGPAMVEQLVSMPALRAQIITHVFDNAEAADVELFKHLDRPASVEKRDVLRCADHHRARHGDGLS